MAQLRVVDEDGDWYELSEPTWRYRAFGPNNEIVIDPGVGERWAMAELGGWRIERQPVYSGAWEPVDVVAKRNGNA